MRMTMMGPRARRAAGLATLLFSAAASAPARADVYSFTNFDGPAPGGTGTTINAINNNGAVVGFEMNATTGLMNFIRNPNGSFTPLNINGDTNAMAFGINDNNAVVGMTGDNNAFLLNGGVFTTLPLASPGNTASEVAFGINKSGVIVGQYQQASDGTMPGFIDRNGVFFDFQARANATQTFLQSVNNNGTAVGFYSINGVNQFPFMINTATDVVTSINPPVIPNLVLTQFLGVNDNGLVSGYYQLPDGSQHGLLYNINTQQYTFLDDPNAPKTGVSITQITGINDSNELSGFYVDANGVQHGFIATAAVPEPGPMLLGGLGLAIAAAWRRFGRKAATA